MGYSVYGGSVLECTVDVSTSYAILLYNNV